MFFDDADRFIKDLDSIISLIKFEKDIKAILSTRTAGLSLVKDQLLLQRVEKSYIHELSILNDKSLEDILCEAAGRSTIKKSREIAEELIYNFKDIVFNSKIPRNSKIAEAPALGKPVALLDVSSPGSVNYLELAEEVINILYTFILCSHNSTLS